jgi:hypothetical protein
MRGRRLGDSGSCWRRFSPLSEPPAEVPMNLQSLRTKDLKKRIQFVI